MQGRTGSDRAWHGAVLPFTGALLSLSGCVMVRQTAGPGTGTGAVPKCSKTGPIM